MTRLESNRDLALEVGFRATDWTQSVTFEIYRQALQDWDLMAIMRDDTCIGAAYLKDGEVHVSVLPEYRRRWATKGLLRQLFSQPRVTTRVTPGHDYMHDILERLGFVNHDGLFVRGY